jgi:hypothetical protein
MSSRSSSSPGSPGARPAAVEDVERICLSLPETELSVTWGDVPTYVVRQHPRPRGFVLYRKPRHDAVDPVTGEEYDDVLLIRTPGMEAKAALVEADGPFFTIDHLRNSAAVLVRLSRLDEVEVDELREVITDAWLAVAPRRLAREHFPDA